MSRGPSIIMQNAPLVHLYTPKPPLIQIEEKETSLIFHYEDAEHQKDAERYYP